MFLSLVVGLPEIEFKALFISFFKDSDAQTTELLTYLECHYWNDWKYLA